MYIISQDRKSIYNTEQFYRICVDDIRIVGYVATSVNRVVIGQYDSHNRAIEVFTEWLGFMLDSCKVIFQDTEISADVAELFKNNVVLLSTGRNEPRFEVLSKHDAVWYLPEK